MKQESLAIAQTFSTPSKPVRQSTLQQKVEHYLKSQLHSNQKSS